MPPIQDPPALSLIAFLLIVAFVVVSFWLGVLHGSAQPSEFRLSLRGLALGMGAWLAIGAVVPLSGVLNIQVLPPPAIVFAFLCFGVGIGVAFSKLGTSLTSLSLVWLVGFHAFRLPLELLLHYWYKVGVIPVQMTYEGFNFDIATGILALFIGLWSIQSQPPKFVVWGFNLVGTFLLIVVVTIAILSTPTPIRQFMNDPPVLLPFYFPYSYIVSVVVTGALLGHIVLFRKLVAKEKLSICEHRGEST